METKNEGKYLHSDTDIIWYKKCFYLTSEINQYKKKLQNLFVFLEVDLWRDHL